MYELKKIDKRQGRDGFALITGDGFSTIIQGGSGNPSNVINLTGGDQFELLSALKEHLEVQQVVA